jgi:hypothetical protein
MLLLASLASRLSWPLSRRSHSQEGGLAAAQLRRAFGTRGVERDRGGGQRRAVVLRRSPGRGGDALKDRVAHIVGEREVDVLEWLAIRVSTSPVLTAKVSRAAAL